MNLCDDGHDEVCHEGRNCPACDAIGDLQNELDDAKNELASAEKQIEHLEEEAQADAV